MQQRRETNHSANGKTRWFGLGDLVMQADGCTMEQKGEKLQPKWKGPLEVRKVFEGQRYLLGTLEGQVQAKHVQGRHLKAFESRRRVAEENAVPPSSDQRCCHGCDEGEDEEGGERERERAGDGDGILRRRRLLEQERRRKGKRQVGNCHAPTFPKLSWSNRLDPNHVS